MNLKKVATLSALALSVLLILTTFKAAAATTLTVGNLSSAPCTGTFPTISAAVAAASAGDTIKVCPGTYPELVTVNKTLIINGAQSGVDARLPSRTGLPATESVVTGTAGTTSFYVTANNVTIDGFTVQGNTNGNVFGAGIVLGAGTSGAHLVNSIIQDNVIGLSLANNPAGNPALIQHNVFRTNNQPGPAGGTAIYTDQFNAGGLLSHVTIDANNFTGNDNAAINFASSQLGSQSNITISNNKMDANGNAVALFDTTTVSVTGNSMTGSLGSQIFIGGGVTGLAISCNSIKNGAGRGIRIGPDVGGYPDPNSNIRINFNSIEGNALGGLAVDTGRYSGGPGSLNAENDWWGSATGPTIASNPGGTGQLIVDPDGVVDYRPFLTSAQGLPCPPPPFADEEQCEKALEQREKAFEAQQKADRKAFNAQPHTKQEKRAFDAQQKASERAFEEELEAAERQCEQLPDNDNEDHHKEKGDKDDGHDKDHE